MWRENIVNFLETWETTEQKTNVIQEIGIKLNSIATGIVYLSDGGDRFGFRDINPVRWVQKRGGLTDFKKYVKKSGIFPGITNLAGFVENIFGKAPIVEDGFILT